MLNSQNNHLKYGMCIWKQEKLIICQKVTILKWPLQYQDIIQLCERLGEYWKNQDANTCNLFQKLKNNTLLKPTHHSSNTQKEFNIQLECCHVEFKDLKEITFAQYFDKVCNLILGRYDSCNDLGSRSWRRRFLELVRNKWIWGCRFS
jgi:hypothetical protein